MSDFGNHTERGNHWPHAAELARRQLDPAQIEQHAIRIIARGIRTQRLVAYVGAGASMAYGRLTWSGLMDHLFEELSSLAPEHLDADGKPLPGTWAAVVANLWGGKAAHFRSETDHPVKAEILAEHFRRLGKGGTLHERTTASLKDHHGYVRELLRKAVLAGAPGLRDDALKKLLEVTDATRLAGKRGLRGSSETICATQRPQGPDDLAELLRKVMRALNEQPIHEGSPLRNLVMEWGIRRFITTNYDGEIERALAALGFQRSDVAERSSLEPMQTSLNFDRHSTGAALTFAFDGSRRHAAVLHLHGDIAKPDSLVVTESDYQRLYLAEHPQRDLVTNASLANFAANPMLFVGSEVNEDDVLRPIRQFMTGPGHRSDRMAVAVFASTRSGPDRAMQAAKLLLKYRVHAIHAGCATVQQEGGLEDKRDPDWLYHFVNASRKFKNLAEAVKAESKVHMPPQNIADIESALGAFNKAWKEVTCASKVRKIEGIEVRKPSGQTPTPRAELLYPDNALSFLKFDERLAWGAKPSGEDASATVPPGTDVSGWTPEVFTWHQVQFEQRANFVMSCFLNAKLISLREKVDLEIGSESRLPRTFRKDVAAQAREHARDRKWIIHSRHRVCMQPETVEGRFKVIQDEKLKQIQSAQHQRFDEGITTLTEAIQRHRGGRFAIRSGRRLIVVCAARGAGKGGQFDHLLRRPLDEAGDADGTRLPPALESLVSALSPGAPQESPRTILHFNLSFSDEVAAMVTHLCDAVFTPDRSAVDGDAPPCKDLLEQLARALIALRQRTDGHRLVLILGNAGVLFGADGEAKNGLVHRVLRMLQTHRHRETPIDIVMYLGESQVPAHLRLGDAASTYRIKSPSPSGGTPRALPDQRLQRRLRRLNIRQHLEDDPGVLVHALTKTRAEQLAAAYFPGLHRALIAPLDRDQSQPRNRLRDLYLETGGSRFAQTLILACVGALVDDKAEQQTQESTRLAIDLLDRITARLRGAASQSSVAATIEVVLDTWAKRFLLGPDLRAHAFPKPRAGQANAAFADASSVMMEACLREPAVGPCLWKLATEMLWHLSAFSHPIELPTLLACQRVKDATVSLQRVLAESSHGLVVPSEASIVKVAAEWLTHWCLLFRISPCSVPKEADAALKSTETEVRYRYATHRHIQRHFLKLMGGRNVESTYWDQFTTSLYVSQPDEAPALRADVHRTLSTAVHQLTGYPDPPGEPPQNARTLLPEASRPALSEDARCATEMLEEADRIRAAYFLVRSTYSMGVVTNMTHLDEDPAVTNGRMEHYRRMVRWIIHAARYWEDERAQARASYWKDARAPQEPMGIFYPGELIWLYNECGVISLAQGKLHDAEQLLSQAEIAARSLESDDSGSLHTRIRLHAALTHIERGRPHLARQMLQPIAERPGGHSMPPFIARFYLGMLEHISGDYRQAEKLYERALAGFQAHRRSRAAAFVLMHQADLKLRVAATTEPHSVIAMAQEAISLAQQGGHEDLRHLAHLARVRLCIQTDTISGEMLFEELNAAQRYAVQMDMPRIACEVHELRARLLAKQGEYMLSAAEATRSLEIAALYDLKLLKARGMLTLAKIYAQRGENTGARDLVRAGKEIATSADYFTCVRGFTKLEMALDRPASAPLKTTARAEGKRGP